MVMLYGRNYTRRDLAAHAGMLSQFGGVRLMTLENGVERGVRMLEFRTGSGLRFNVMADRGFDLGECEHNGRAVGWVSPTGFRHPGLHEPESEGGLGFLRSFSGLLSTCGLDHALAMTEESAAHYFYRFRGSVKQPLHGRIANIPGHLSSYGEIWEGDECTLFCEGTVQQSTVFGEDLHLVRRIEAKVGGNEIVLKDRVMNHGFYRTPHMLLYHIDVGHPVVAEGSRYLAPIRDVIWAAHAGENYTAQQVSYRRYSAPKLNFREQVWEFDMATDRAGNVPVAIVNDGMNFGLMVETAKAELPCYYQWQNFQSGLYTVGLEPGTNHILGKDFARDRGELIWLEHDEHRSYTVRFTILDGAKETKAAETRIHTLAKQPESDYPELSDRFPKLDGR
jgi:Domain of unknown function (DUF4432)